MCDEENNGNGEVDERFIAVNGCPAECASKEFMTYKIDPHEVATITKDFDPENYRKYEVLLDIGEEIDLVQEAINNINN